MDEKTNVIVGGIFVATFMIVGALYYFAPVIGSKQYKCKDGVLWEKRAEGIFVKTDKQCIEVKE